MKDSSFDIVTIGDCAIDAFLEIHEASLHCKLNRKSCELCFKYGDKIPIENLEFQVGGNAANVSVGLARLGLKTSIATTIGVDELSAKIINFLKREGVNTELIKKETGTSSNFSASINFQGERTIFAHHIKRDHELGELPQTSWVYLTSLGEYWQQVYEETCRKVQSSNIKLALSPGSHQLEADPKLLKVVLSLTTIIFVNKDEAVKIVNRDKNMKQLLVALQKLGPKIVSITDGINGSWSILEDGGILHFGILPTNIVERTGAGDAYAAGFLGAFIKGEPISRAMAWGAANAASVIEKVGAQRGLLTREEIEERLENN